MATRALTADVTPPSETGRRRHRRRPYVVAGLGLLVLVALLVGMKALEIGKAVAAGKRAQAAGPPPEAVGSYEVQRQQWDETLTSVGSVAAARGVSISNDTSGIVWKIDFESGATVHRGQVLVELDTRVERAQLASAQAREQLAATNVQRTRALVASGSVAPSQLDTDQAAFAGATADANALAAQIERKTVRAPFAGKLGIRLVNVGQYLGPGTPITVLESSEATYVDFDLPQQDLSRVGVGMPVRLTLGTGDGGAAAPTSSGAVFAIDPDVDPATRNIRVRASVPPDDDRLRPGMFVDVAVVEPQKEDVVAIPATAVVHAPYGDSVFVVEGHDGALVARQQFVKLGHSRGDFVAVAEGLQPGQRVVSAGAFKLRNGSRVVIDNQVALHPELAPNPPNR